MAEQMLKNHSKEEASKVASHVFQKETALAEGSKCALCAKPLTFDSFESSRFSAVVAS